MAIKSVKKTKFPMGLQAVLWSLNVSSLDMTRDRGYIIHQVLAYGSAAHIRWLLKTYPGTTIRAEVKNHPHRIYSKPAFNFLQQILFPTLTLNRNRYVKTIF